MSIILTYCSFLLTIEGLRTELCKKIVAVHYVNDPCQSCVSETSNDLKQCLRPISPLCSLAEL